MTCTATHIEKGGLRGIRRPARAVVLCLGLILAGLGSQSLAQTGGEAEARERRYTPAQRVFMFQDGVDAYRLGLYRKSYENWLPLARAGDHAAQRNIAHLWFLGLGVQRSLTEALSWLELAANGGIVEANTQLGLLYASHPEIDRDYIRAARFLYVAARQNDLRAQYNLGLMYENGLGVDASSKIAAQYYGFAARAGHRRASQRLAVLELSPDISGGLPPAPKFDPALVAGTAQPRVIDPAADENQRALDNLVSAIRRSGVPSGSGAQGQNQPGKAGGDLLASLSSAVSKRDAKGRGQLPASAFIDDGDIVAPATPAVVPETPEITPETVEVTTAPAAPAATTPAPVAATPDTVPETVEVASAPAVPAAATPAMVPETAGKRPQPDPAPIAVTPTDSDAQGLAEKQADGALGAMQPAGAIAESALARPLPAAESDREIMRVAGLKQVTPVIPAGTVTGRQSALPDPEKLAPTHLEAMQVNAPASAGNLQNPANETIVLSRGERPRIVIRPASEFPAASKPMAAAYVLDVTAGTNAVMVNGAARRALPLALSPVSMAVAARRGEALIAFDAPVTKPIAKPRIVAPPVAPAPVSAPGAGKPVQIASAPRQKRPASRPMNKAAGKAADSAAALAAYKRGDLVRAHQIWAALAARSDVEATFWLGRLYNRGEGVPRDPVRAYELFRNAARSGYSPAITALANVQARMSNAQLESLERALSSN